MPARAAGVDADGDGLPDNWETSFGLDPASADGDDGSAGDPDGDGVANDAELAAASHPRGFHVRRLAEGADNAFFTWQLALANPHDADAHLLVSTMADDGSVWRKPLVLPALSRRTLSRADLELVTSAFSIQVESDLEIGVDRTMTWSGGLGSHAETAVAAASTRWIFAEGATGGPFNLFYLLQNPNPRPARVTVRYLRPSPAPPIDQTYDLGPMSRYTIWVDQVPGLAATDVSASITSTEPLVAERAMYADTGSVPFRAGHVSAGATAPATAWFLAEGATGGFFDFYVLLANPDTRAADVTLTYLLTDGTTRDVTRTLAPESRVTIRVDDEAGLANAALSVRVVSTNGVPIVVERTMWWPDGDWIEAHNSFASTTAGPRWLLAEGESGGPTGVTTFVLVANTAAVPATIRATLLFEDRAPVSRSFVLAPTSRFNIDVAAEFPDARERRYATLVESLGPSPAAIVVERSVYASPGGRLWEAGTNAAALPLATPLVSQPDVRLFAGQAPVDLDLLPAGLPAAWRIVDAISSAPDVAGVSIDTATGRLVLTPVAAGTVTVTVTARMPKRAPLVQRFTVTVGAAVSFGPPTTFTNYLFPAAADFDGDGRDELLGTTRDAGGNLIERDLRDMGLGTLADLFPAINRDNRVADYTGDGVLDVVAQTYTSIDDTASTSRLYVGNGDGTFTESPAFAALGIRGRGETIVTADFDNDGDLDLFLPQYTHEDPREHFRLLLNDGRGGFTDVSDAAGVATRGWPVDLRVEGAQAADLDGDGWLDLYAASHVYMNTGVVDGIPRFVDRREALGLPLFFDEGMRLFDADNDGILDLVLHHFAFGPALYRGTGSGFTPVPLPQAPFAGSYGINACDLNGDGWEDLIAAPGTLGLTRFYLNTGNGFVFNPPTSLDGVAGDVSSCADFDGDHRLDIGRRARIGASNLLGYALNTTPHDGHWVLLDVVDADGARNQQGRVVRIRPRAAPGTTYTRIVDGGAGLLAQRAYTLLVGTPHDGEFDVTIRFAGGARTFVVRAGQRTRLFADGRSQVY